MALPNENELIAMRERHERAVLSGVDTVASASAAHDDRERLLGAVERLLAVEGAARIVLHVVQRGALPPVARSALRELHIALADLAKAGVDHDHDGADEEPAEDVRMSA